MKSLLLLLLLLPLALRAQLVPSQPRRLELYLDPDYSDVRVLPMADSSVVLFIGSQQGTLYRWKYEFQQLDRHLQQIRTVPVEADRRYDLIQTCSATPYAYALFKSEYDPAKFQVYRYDQRTGTVVGFGFDTEKVSEVYDLEVLDGKLFSTVLVDQHLTVLHIDVDREEFQLLPAVYESVPTELTFLPDSATGRAGYVVSQSNGFRNRLQIKQLSAQGRLLASRFIQAESGRGLLTAQLSPGDTTERLLTGTYTLRDSRYSQGLFASNLPSDLTVRPPLRFYDFAVLKHFFDFMKPRRAARMRARSAERRAAGSELRLHYRILTHRLLPFQDGYALVAEVYFPHYRTGSPYGWNMFSPTRQYFNSTSTRQYYDGYRSTQAIVCGFDRNGTLLWDNTFVLKDVEHSTLTETVRVRPLPDGQRLALAYLDDDKIRYKIIDRTTSAPNDLQVPLLTNTEGRREKTTSTSEEEMLAWYGSRFLAYGYQRVRADHGNSRQVFFLNVVAFDETSPKP